jgi:predicted O-linked N-acetylglucosamine transferase (SPINDLY family)
MSTLSIDAAIELARHQLNAGGLDQAKEICRLVLEASPGHADALFLAGTVFLKQKDGRCIELLRRSLAARPGWLDAQANIATAFQVLGRIDEAIEAHRATLQLDATSPSAWFNFGNALASAGRVDEAIDAYRQATRLDRQFAAAQENMAKLLVIRGQIPELTPAQEAPPRPTPFENAAPTDADAHHSMGLAFQRLGRIDDAIAAYRAAIAASPDFAAAYANLGVMLASRGDVAEAIVSARRAVELNPGLAELRINLGAILLAANDPEGAIAAAREGIRLAPELPEAHNNLGTGLKEIGALGDALASFRRARELRPGYATAHSNEIYTLHFLPEYDASAILSAHRQWDAIHAGPLAPSMPAWAVTADPDRPLRIGLVSPDFREHVVGHFLKPLFQSHDPNQIELIAYSDVAAPDEETRQFQASAESWRDTGTLGDQELDGLIRNDRVDILVDLTMHMSRHRLLVFARKPAPLAVTYLAYCSTTGVAAIDYRLSDHFLDPPGETEGDYSEHTERLRTYWCYPAPSAPDPAPQPPAATRGFVTFGCFNNYCKISAPTWDAWARILSAVADSRLMVYAPPGGHRQCVRERFSEQGIDPGRLEFVGRVSREDYFARYNQIDIALDPFPYSGGTTTCDALWMGVPVVTMRGGTAVGRGGCTILGQIGLFDWVNANLREYVDRACFWAENLVDLAEWRQTLRDRMLDSPLMDGAAFARDFELTMRSIWRTWCAGKSSDSH